MQYVYPAVLHAEANGEYSALFPDLKGCVTQGKDLPETLYEAQDALNFWLEFLEDEGLVIPAPSDIRTLKLEENQIATLILADTKKRRLNGK